MAIDPILTGVVVGKVAKEAGNKLVSESKLVGAELVAAAKDTEIFQGAVDNYATRIAIRQDILTKMYKPIAKMFKVSNKYFTDEFEKDMAEKLASVPEENLTAPKTSIAAPAMQHLGFSLGEPNLKDMYLELLATASDDRTQDDAHPSFVEVIKQLNSVEAELLKTVIEDNIPIPIVTLKINNSGKTGGRLAQRNVIELLEASTGSPAENPRLGAYIDNWVRLGLAEITYTEWLAGAGAYDWVQDRPEYARTIALLAPEKDESIRVDKGMIRATDFGAAFSRAVGLAK